MIDLRGCCLAVILVLGLAPSHTALADGGRHDDSALEALLPRKLAGVALTVESQSGAHLASNSAALDAMLAGLGKGRSEFSLASAYARSGLKAAIGAWRVTGADPAALLSGFATAVQASSAVALTQVDETIGRRLIKRIGDAGQLAQGPLYVLGRGDTLLFVQTPQRDLAEEALAKLPE